jgi:hypothetical protein
MTFDARSSAISVPNVNAAEQPGYPAQSAAGLTVSRRVPGRTSIGLLEFDPSVEVGVRGRQRHVGGVKILRPSP